MPGDPAHRTGRRRAAPQGQPAARFRPTSAGAHGDTAGPHHPRPVGISWEAGWPSGSSVARWSGTGSATSGRLPGGRGAATAGRGDGGRAVLPPHGATGRGAARTCAGSVDCWRSERPSRRTSRRRAACSSGCWAGHCGCGGDANAAPERLAAERSDPCKLALGRAHSACIPGARTCRVVPALCSSGAPGRGWRYGRDVAVPQALVAMSRGDDARERAPSRPRQQPLPGTGAGQPMSRARRPAGWAGHPGTAWPRALSRDRQAGLRRHGGALRREFAHDKAAASREAHPERASHDEQRVMKMLAGLGQGDLLAGEAVDYRREYRVAPSTHVDFAWPEQAQGPRGLRRRASGAGLRPRWAAGRAGGGAGGANPRPPAGTC